MQMQHPLPNAMVVPSISVEGLMDATLRLSDIMAAEADILKSMRYKDLAPLQDEKARLTQQLEAYQAQLARDPSFMKMADAATREELLLLADDLTLTVEDNFRQVASARAINQRVLQAIMDVMSEQHRPGVYDKQGVASSQSDLALSMNLNQKA